MALIAETYVINSKIFQSVILNGNVLTRSMDFKGLTGNINISSFSILIKLPVLLYLIYKEKKHLYLLLNFLLVSSIISILVLFSRAAIIGLILLMIISLLYYLVKEKRTVVVQTILVSLSVSISYLTYNFLNENTFDLIEERFSTVTQPTNDESVLQRVTFYKIALEDIKNYPLTGVELETGNYHQYKDQMKYLAVTWSHI